MPDVDPLAPQGAVRVRNGGASANGQLAMVEHTGHPKCTDLHVFRGCLRLFRVFFHVRTCTYRYMTKGLFRILHMYFSFSGVPGLLHARLHTAQPVADLRLRFVRREVRVLNLGSYVIMNMIF